MWSTIAKKKKTAENISLVDVYSGCVLFSTKGFSNIIVIVIVSIIIITITGTI